MAASPARRRTYRLTIAYHGAAFSGFRRQLEGRTVEGTVLEALRDHLRPPIRVAVAGATDRGVHALAQVLSLVSRGGCEASALGAAIEAASPPSPGPTCFAELDRVLGDHALRVTSANEVDRSFHASFSAAARRYRYAVETEIEAARIASLLRLLVGERCFSAFARDTPPGRSTVKHLNAVQTWREGSRVVIELTARGFLRRQVRVMVSTALREASRGAPDRALLDLARRADRAETAAPAPADGLCLWSVDYDRL